jgi:Ankyrin repeat
MPDRRLPVRPDLDQLKHQARDLLRAIRRGDPEAIGDLRRYHPNPVEPVSARLADAQLVLARTYQAPSWPRLAVACRLIDAIWRDDLEEVRALIRRHPRLIHESALIQERNWGPPMSYAANLGRDRIIEALHALGARDHMHALQRAALQSRIETARLVHRIMGAAIPPSEAFDGPAYTLSVEGTALLFELGASLPVADGRVRAPASVVLETDGRNPAAKHAILEMYVAHGMTLPDTPTMALHRGRLDLLEEHLDHDPTLLRRAFSAEEIFPREFGCRDDGGARTPLAGGTLLHLAVDYDEIEIARWLLGRGMAADVRAAVDREGFGGHTPLFGTVVSYPNFWLNHSGRSPAPFAELLLSHGADPNARASLRERLGSPEAGTRGHRGITPIGWGERFHDRLFVSEPAIRVIAERGGQQ